LFHVQHALVTAVSGPLATKERAAHQALAEAREQLERLQTTPPSAGDATAKRRPGRPAKEPVSLAQAEPALAAAHREPERLAEQRAQSKASIRGIGHDYHCVDRERGGRRNGRLLAAAIQAHIEPVRVIARYAGLSQSCLERSETAERVVPNRQGTIEFVSRYVGQQVAQLDVTPPVAFAVHAKLTPSSYRDRVAETRSISDGKPLRALAERLRTPLCAPGGALSILSPETHDQLHDEAKRLASVFQRSRSNVEGRNGYFSLRSHQLRGLDLPRKREGFTALHNFFLTRPDGTTAAERFFGQKPRSMFVAMLASVELPPAPLRPPRRA
jgi:hypothetical protein